MDTFIQCEKCMYVSNRESNVRRHYTLMHEPLSKLIHCSCCNIKFVTKYEYCQHSEQIHANGYKCPSPGCGKIFSRNVLLDRHYKTHTGEKSFKCGYCGYRSCNRSNVGRHCSARHKNKPLKVLFMPIILEDDYEDYEDSSEDILDSEDDLSLVGQDLRKNSVMDDDFSQESSEMEDMDSDVVFFSFVFASVVTLVLVPRGLDTATPPSTAVRPTGAMCTRLSAMYGDYIGVTRNYYFIQHHLAFGTACGLRNI
uniref:C2H2-type domain-containing protein n=1 Tax=Strigamia maritima TaxID=126957 RepID=T1JNM0_STRMM